MTISAEELRKISDLANEDKLKRLYERLTDLAHIGKTSATLQLEDYGDVDAVIDHLKKNGYTVRVPMGHGHAFKLNGTFIVKW